jgi:CelD/BcsL family acetyltransferase involved in cellulose biosynthesis
LHTIEEEPARLEPLVRRTFDSRVEWMQEHARTSPAFRDADFRAVMEALDQASGVALLGFLLACDGQPAASQWGFRYLDRYYAYMSGKDPRFEPFSVGRVHLAMVVEACKARGISVLELMAPPADYKLTWATHRKPLASLALPFSLRGRVLLDLFLGTLLPAAHATSRMLPRAVRDPLVNTLFNR